MILKLRRLIQRKEGQAMVESLIVLPILVIIFACVFYLGEGISYKVRIQGAARYLALKTSREEPIGDLQHKFFHNGPNPLGSTRSETYGRILGMVWVALIFFIRWPPHILPGLLAMFVLPDDAIMARVGAEVPTPEFMSWVGSHTVSADCGIDADEWKLDSYFWELWAFKRLYYLHFLIFEGYDPTFARYTGWPLVWLGWMIWLI